MSSLLRVLVVDDEPPAVDELCYFLRQHDGVEVAATAGSATEAMRHLDATNFDEVFLDIALPDLVGLSVAFVYLPIMWDLRGWHDRAARTLVVEARRST